jgi:hypothetical protein
MKVRIQKMFVTYRRSPLGMCVICPRQEAFLDSVGVTSSHTLMTKECVLNSTRSDRVVSVCGVMVKVTSHRYRSMTVFIRLGYSGVSRTRLDLRLEWKDQFIPSWVTNPI